MLAESGKINFSIDSKIVYLILRTHKQINNKLSHKKNREKNYTRTQWHNKAAQQSIYLRRR